MRAAPRFAVLKRDAVYWHVLDTRRLVVEVIAFPAGDTGATHARTDVTCEHYYRNPDVVPYVERSLAARLVRAGHELPRAPRRRRP